MNHRNTDRRFPSRKISETFLEFLNPILEVMNDEEDDQEARSIYDLGFAVWNAVVYADAVNEDKYMQAVEGMLTAHPDARPLIERLITRKRESYGNDHRLIGNYELKTVDGEIRLKVEAWSPYSEDGKAPH